MNRYKFSEEEVPYGILEQFGLTREMIGDLPVNVLQAIHSGRRSPILPIRVDDSEGNTIHARTRFSLVRREDGTADVLFYPVLVESRLERFNEEQKQRLLEGKPVIAPMQGDSDTPVQAFHQIDSGTKQILSVPTPVIGRNLQIIADEFHLSHAEINCLRVGEPLTVALCNGSRKRNASGTSTTSAVLAAGSQTARAVSTMCTRTTTPRKCGTS